MLEKSRLQIAHLVQFLLGCRNPLVKYGKNVNNRLLFVHRRLIHAYVGQLVIFQIPCVRGQALRELLKLLNEPPILERILNGEMTVYAGLTIPAQGETPLAPCHIRMVLYTMSPGSTFL